MVTHDHKTQDREDDLVESTSDEDGVTPDPDLLFQALSESIRRQCLVYLLDDPETTASELADVIAGWQSTTDGVVGPKQREQIAIELRHVHLPVLATADLIEYESPTGTVRLTDVSQSVRDVVRTARRYEQATENTS